jgi:hypothetical protein
MPGQSYCPFDRFHLHGLLIGVGGEEGFVVVVGVGAAVGAPGTPTQTKTSA